MKKMNLKSIIGGLFMSKEEKLNKQVSEQQETIKRLGGRVSALADKLAMLESNIKTFKQNVAADVKRLVEISTKR
jgi:predicted RNase H-like nuclease (RuvC/YqgF family)